jgi:hypothetical protein
MFLSQMIVAIKSNGEVLREEGKKVFLPFGSEYSILFRNMNMNQRALIDVRIDGKGVVGAGLILGAGEEVELERAIDSNRPDGMDRGHKFKFIEMTPSIENYRGIRPDDGYISVSFQFEKIRRYAVPERGICSQTYDNGIGISAKGAMSRNYSAGITGMGRVSNQRFHTASIGELENNVHIFCFLLLGQVNSGGTPIQISRPVTTATKKICSLCGRGYPVSAMFCSDDGNALQYEDSIF